MKTQDWISAKQRDVAEAAIREAAERAGCSLVFIAKLAAAMVRHGERMGTR